MIQAIKKAHPILDEKGRPCTFPTFASQVYMGDGTSVEAAIQNMNLGNGSNNDTQIEPCKIPSGGSTGQLLAKYSDDDFAIEWIDAPVVDKLIAPFFVGQNTTSVSAGFDSQPTSSSTKVFTAPKNGMFCLFANRGNTSGNTLRLHVMNPDDTINFTFHFPAYEAYATATAMIPVAKGMKLKMDTDATSATWTVRTQSFFYNIIDDSAGEDSTGDSNNSGNTVVVSGLSVDEVYPVGSIYMSVDSTSPASRFANTTWEQLKDRFLIGAGGSYSNGATGGAATTTIAEKNLPWNTTILSQYGSKLGNYSRSDSNSSSAWGFSALSDAYKNASGGVYADGTNYNVTMNTMPPYLGVYMWKRVS